MFGVVVDLVIKKGGSYQSKVRKTILQENVVCSYFGKLSEVFK
jgi:hypothetical protein